MKCFNHPNVDAVAFCKKCLKGICRDCATEKADGVICKNGCVTLYSRLATNTNWKLLIVVWLIIIAVAIAASIGYVTLRKHNQEAAMTAAREDGKALAHQGADAIQVVLSRAVADGELTLDDLFDTSYVLIPNSDPPKYHTRFDAFLDVHIQEIEDRMLENPQVVFAIAVDRNDYLPTHNAKYSQPLTGNYQKDRIGNRTKRIFNDPIGLAAAKNEKDALVQTYMRNTGELMLDVAVPISIDNRHWGAFRVGVAVKQPRGFWGS